MKYTRERLRRWLPPLRSALPIAILSVAAVSFPLAAAQDLRLSRIETISWILALYGLPGLLSLILAIRYRQPVLVTGNVMVLVFLTSLGGRFSYAELVAAGIAAGMGVAVLAALGLTDRLASWIPAPVVHAVLAGAVLPFVAGVFTSFGETPVLVGGMLVGYLLSQRFLGPRFPAVVPALASGLIVAGISGQLGPAPEQVSFPLPTVTWPAFSGTAIATVAPVLVVFMTLQSNLPSIVFLRDQGYTLSERALNMVCGAGTAAASLLGPTAMSLSLSATALVAGSAAGGHHFRYRSVYVSGSFLILIGLLASVVAIVPDVMPTQLLLSVAGLAVVGVLGQALQEIARGHLLLGPLLAFAISVSEMSVIGLGSLFWALVIGSAVSILLERDEPGRSGHNRGSAESQS